MRAIRTDLAPTPRGHYAQAIVHQGLVYVSGQLPIDPQHPDQAVGDIRRQTEQTLQNVEAILIAAGSELSLLLQVTVYITDLSLWAEVNEVYGTVLGDHRPARAIVPVTSLNKGSQIEIQAIAALRTT
ncbi:MAG: Rid family detoxifying hydrolase [Gemmatimonadota bacterium]